MDKSFMKQQRFSFRKMKVGLASVAILFAFAQVGQVSADETTQPASTSAETVKKTEANKSNQMQNLENLLMFLRRFHLLT